MKQVLTKIGFLIKLWSFLIILPVTDDNNFGTLEIGKESQKSYRISLIGLFWGNKAIYLISYGFTRRVFSWFYVLKMEECGPLKDLCDNENEEQKAENYVCHLCEPEITEEDIKLESEFLLYSNDLHKRRMELGERKINLYTTVILAIIPLILVMFKINTFLSYTIWEKILTVYLFYFLLNIVLLVFRSMQVKGYTYSRFSKLKSSNDKRLTLSGSYYFDWRMNQGYAERFISYVLNVENFIKYALIFAFLLALSINLRSIGVFNASKSDYNYTSNIVTIDQSFLDNPYSLESINMAELQLRMQKNKKERIIVLIPSAENQNAIYPYFQRYNQNGITYIVDEKMDNNIIKIIEE